MRRSILLSLICFLLSFSMKAQPYNGFGTSNLPLVAIFTDGNEIPDDPKIDARMGIVWNGAGQMNASSDAFNHYNGKIAIEIRGSSSQMFPKKSYGFELKDETGEDLNQALLDMPEENDWILYAPYSDKTLIRNVLTFTLDASLGHYSPRCRYVELFLNDQYQGVYVLMEKIKRDKNRVDIARLLPEDVSAEEISGGYIIKIDKSTGGGGEGWYSKYFNNSNKYTYFQYEYPKTETMAYQQKLYIRNYVEKIEKALFDNNLDGENGFRSLADESGFIDYMLMNELSKNIDGYRLSTFLYKDKGEKLKMGPIWDFNLAYGNANYYRGEYTSGFQFQADLGEDYWQNPFWWKILFADNTFRRKLKERWQSLRRHELSDQQITFVVDSLTGLLHQAQGRNFSRWSVLGEWVWPNAYVGLTYQSEISWMKNWIAGRLAWLDAAIDDLYVAPVEEELAEISVYPNPFRDGLQLKFSDGLTENLILQLFNVHGSLQITRELDSQANPVQIEGLHILPAGVYLIRLSSNERVYYSGKLVKY
ncbi:CotH kinase family protein [Gaoshiqia sp. Z1-71]|uniref:CotH kinase family protein n=1 Tax=Gaoshiqia hydrogeniformans TaxID=3290090 RepID=UPI003BF7946E